MRITRPAWAPIILILITASYNADADPGLWVPEPERVAYAIANMTTDANQLGLTDTQFEAALREKLSGSGITAYRAKRNSEGGILFLDLVVEDRSFVASLEFWRKAEYTLPDGTVYSDHVTVWEEYFIGDHQNDPQNVSESVDLVIDAFVRDYRQSNGGDDAALVAAQNVSGADKPSDR